MKISLEFKSRWWSLLPPTIQLVKAKHVLWEGYDFSMALLLRSNLQQLEDWGYLA